MSGIVNSTGAKSGIIGTTVGTPSSVAGTNVFYAYATGDWTTYGTSVLIPFNQEKYDPDNVYTIASSRFDAPATGVYMFGFHIFTGDSDSNNKFAFHIDGDILDRTAQSTDIGHTYHNTSDDHIEVASTVIVLTNGQNVSVHSGNVDSDVYRTYSFWWGYRLK